MNKIFMHILPLGFLFFFSINCGGSGESKKITSEKVTKVEKVKISLPPELGGVGFEKIAKDMGYQTYEIQPGEEELFGDSQAVKGGSINYIHTLFPRTMRIYGQNSGQVLNRRTIQELCYQPLLERHPVTLEFIPSLATHWKISDDKMQFWFRINPDSRWSDGMPVTSADVIATWDILMDETILEPSNQIIYGKYERPIAVSEYIVSVKAKTLNWRNLLYFGSDMYLLPAHYLNELDGTAYLEEYLFKVMPGTGPYTVHDKDIINQESFTLTRRDDYWAKENPFNLNRFNFDKIKIYVVKDNDALEFEKLKKGKADFKEIQRSRRWIEECDFEATQKGWLKKQKIYSDRPPGTSGYFFNMRKWPFDDKRVRFAFSYLYNREQMNREMYYNEYDMMNSLYSGTIYENPDNPKFHYNPEKAVQLLKEAGYTKRNNEGWLIHEPTGRVLSFELQLPKTSEYMATPVQQMLKEYGMDMQIKFVDYNTMIKNVNERNFSISMLAYSGVSFPNPETSLKSILADQNDNNNVWGFKSERVDGLLDEYDISFNQKRRSEIIREIDGIFNEEHPTSYSIVRNYIRMMWWDKFGYPDWMFELHQGDRWSIFKYWWVDPVKEKQLKAAMEDVEALPILEVENKFWPEYKVKLEM